MTNSYDRGVGVATKTVDSAGLPSEPLTVEQDAPVAEHIRSGLDTRLRVLVAHDPGTRTGEDPEDLHQMRVSVRRMRAMLKSGKPFLDQSWSEPLRSELGWLGRALGPVRDLDVLLLELTHQSSDFNAEERAAAQRLIGELETEHAGARRELLEALNTDRYLDALRRVTAAVTTPGEAPVSTDDSHRLLHDLVRSQFDKLAKGVRKAGSDATDEQLHQLRVRGKGLRYTAELAAPVFGSGMKDLLKTAKGFQDVLGAHQDAVVAEERMRRVLDEMDKACEFWGTFVGGRLVERESARRAARRGEWWEAWEKLRTRAQRSLEP